MFSLSLLYPRLGAALHRCAETHLLERARRGEREAVAVLLGRYRDRVTALAYSILRDRDEAEDAAQEVFVRAFARLPAFRGESAFSTWLYRWVLNERAQRTVQLGEVEWPRARGVRLE